MTGSRSRLCVGSESWELPRDRETKDVSLSVRDKYRECRDVPGQD